MHAYLTQDETMTRPLLTVEERHKRRVLQAIQANETRRETYTPKPEIPRRRYAVRRIRWDRPLPHELLT